MFMHFNDLISHYAEKQEDIIYQKILDIRPEVIPNDDWYLMDHIDFVYDFIKKYMMDDVIEYFYADAIRIENLVITPEDFDLLNKLDILDQDANGTYLKGKYMGHIYEVHAFIYNNLAFVCSIKCITDYKECSSLFV
jgi:hypothetical protein